MALLLAVPIRSQELNRDSVPTIHVYKSADELPSFPGGIDGFQRFVEKNLIYPAEAWQDTVYTDDSVLQFIIRRDGVACGLKQNGMHPAMYKEWQRLFSIMPLWTPATINGYPVDVEYSISVDTYDSMNTGFPFHVVRLMNRLGNSINSNKKFGEGIDKEKMEKMAADMGEIVNITPENVRVALSLTKLYTSLGKDELAILVSQKGLKEIRNLGLKRQAVEENRPQFISEGSLIHPSNYDGKLYMEAALLYALTCDAAGNKDETKKAYEYASHVIDERIFLKDIWKSKKNRENEMYCQLMAEKQVLATMSNSPGITLNSSERSAMFNHGWVSSETMRAIDKKVEEGKIDNPRIRQINAQLREMAEERRKNPPMGKDSLYLYGLRAMVIDLSGGQPALNHYVDSMLQSESVGSKLKSYLSKLMKNRQKHAAVLENREAVVRSLAGYAPINKEGESKEERKQRAKEFYKYRDAMKAVYPLEWLWKQ